MPKSTSEQRRGLSIPRKSPVDISPQNYYQTHHILRPAGRGYGHECPIKSSWSGFLLPKPQPRQPHQGVITIRKKKIIVPALMPQAYIISKSCSSPMIEGQYDPDPVRDEETEAQRGEATAQRRTAGRRQSQILIPIPQTFDLFREP